MVLTVLQDEFELSIFMSAQGPGCVKTRSMI